MKFHKLKTTHHKAQVHQRSGQKVFWGEESALRNNWKLLGVDLAWPEVWTSSAERVRKRAKPFSLCKFIAKSPCFFGTSLHDSWRVSPLPVDITVMITELATVTPWGGVTFTGQLAHKCGWTTCEHFLSCIFWGGDPDSQQYCVVISQLCWRWQTELTARSHP